MRPKPLTRQGIVSSFSPKVVFRLCCCVLVMHAATLKADQFHYSNVIIGDRAMGLGGAFGGVSDDASGVFYNPAGLAFALSNDISGSANAFYTRKVVYEKTIGDDAFVEQSGGSIPSFFGGLQKLDQQIDGLVAAFGVYTTDGDLKDQDDLIEGKSIGNLQIVRFHRTVNLSASTLYAAGAAALRLTSNFGIGVGLGYFTVNELVQEYQDVMLQTACRTASNQTYSCLKVTTQNIRQHLTAMGLEPVLGLQWAVTGRLSLGLTLKTGFLLAENLQIGRESRGTDIELANAQPYINGQGVVAQNVNQSVGKFDIEDPLGGWPMETRFALAWFHSTRLLFTTDIVYRGGVDKGQKIYEKGPVVNYAFGTEYYLLPSLPVRFGVFTNYDARPKIDPGKTDQPDNIDYLGGTLFLAWVQPNSQVAVGAIVQNGSGEAQKLQGSKTIQEVKASAFTFAFSATHNF